MAKIGRNDPCPCGSGRKYKRCCLRQRSSAGDTGTDTGELKISLMAEIGKVQEAARRKEEVVRELGVFVFWSNREGDAWLFEISESDAVQVAASGKALDPPIDENQETIEINWSHTFEIRDRQLYLVAYADKKESCIAGAPTKRIHAAIRRIKKKFSEDVLSQVHVHSEGSDQTAA